MIVRLPWILDGDNDQNISVSLQMCYLKGLCTFIIPLLHRKGGGGGILFYLCQSFRPSQDYFSSHFSQQLLMSEIWYLVTTFIYLLPSPCCTRRHTGQGLELSTLLYPELSSLFLPRLSPFPLALPPQFASKLLLGGPSFCAILWEAFLDPSDCYFLFADLVGFYTH